MWCCLQLLLGRCCWGTMCQQSAETRQVVDYITLYQSVVRGINWFQILFVFELGSSTKKSSILVQLQASVCQPGMQREVSVLNFFSETGKSAEGYWGKWWREETPFLTSAVCCSIALSYNLASVFFCSMLLCEISVCKWGHVVHYLCCVAVMAVWHDTWLYNMGRLIWVR